MMIHNKTYVVTLDGPSGTGKGTICHMLAKYLNWHFLDSGVIYRLLAYAAKKKSISFDNAAELVACAHQMRLHFATDDHNNNLVYLNDEEIYSQLRLEACGHDASLIATIPEVRIALLEKQRAFVKPPGLIADGRDMGTVVFPNADLKIYLDASIEERVKRRYLQLKDKSNNVSLAQVRKELIKRDCRDKTRDCAPLKIARHAIVVDTTELTIVQSFEQVLVLVQKHLFHS
ncbi:MAG: (d)CMP kinase [Legionella sp.]